MITDCPYCGRTVETEAAIPCEQEECPLTMNHPSRPETQAPSGKE